MENLTLIGTLILTAIGFLLGRFYSETERILSEKRKFYVEYLNSLPRIEVSFRDISKEDFAQLLEPINSLFPKLSFYADKHVMKAYQNFFHSLWHAHLALSPDSPPDAPEHLALIRASNDLVHQMRRDAFRWSLFRYKRRRMMEPVPLPKII